MEPIGGVSRAEATEFPPVGSRVSTVVVMLMIISTVAFTAHACPSGSPCGLPAVFRPFSEGSELAQFVSRL